MKLDKTKLVLLAALCAGALALGCDDSSDDDGTGGTGGGTGGDVTGGGGTSEQSIAACLATCDTDGDLCLMDPAVEGGPSTVSGVCDGTACRLCAEDADCVAVFSGAAIYCDADAPCAAGECIGNRCFFEPDGDGNCILADASPVDLDNIDGETVSVCAVEGSTCSNGVCSASGEGLKCPDDFQCPGDLTCTADGTCECSGDADCESVPGSADTGATKCIDNTCQCDDTTCGADQTCA